MLYPVVEYDHSYARPCSRPFSITLTSTHSHGLAALALNEFAFQKSLEHRDLKMFRSIVEMD